MLAGGAVQGLDASFRLPQRLRVELDARGVLAQRAHRLPRLRLGRFEEFNDTEQVGIVS